MVLQLPREQRPALFERAHHVAAEGGVLLQKLVPPAIPQVVRGPPVLAHQPAQQRQRLDRPDERVPLDQLLLVPEEAVELARVERPEAAPEHEPLRRSDGRDRVELQEAEPPDRVDDALRGAVEQLRADGDSARFLRADGYSIHRGPPMLVTVRARIAQSRDDISRNYVVKR